MATRIEVEELLRETGWVRRLVAGLLGDAGDVDDVVQETCVAALAADRARLEARGEHGVRSWLARVARNLALRRRRDAAVRRRHEALAASVRGSETGEGDLGRLRALERLAAALGELEEPYRSALVQRYLDDLPHAEVARRAGITTEAARQRVARGVAKLRARLEREWGSGEGLASALVVLVGPRALPGGLWIGGVIMAAKWAVGAAGVAAVAMIAVRASREREPELAAPAAEDTRIDPRALPPSDGTARLDALASEPERSSERAPLDEVAAPRIDSVLVTLVDREGIPLVKGWVGLADDGVDVFKGVDREGCARVELGGRSPAGGIELLAGGEGFVTRRARAEGPRATIELARLPSVSGRLVDPEGRPIESPAQARLSVFDADDGEERSVPAAVDARGQFRCEAVPLGRLNYAAGLARGFVETTAELGLELVPEGALVVELVLERGVTVIGRVLDARTKEPLPGARVFADEFGYEPESLRPHAIADEEGRYELTGVEAHRNLGEGGHVLALLAVCAEDDGHAAPLTRYVSAEWRDDARYEADLELEPSDAAITGVVYEHGGIEPARGATIYAVGEAGGMSSTVGGEGGDFRLGGLLPGEFKLFVLDGPFDDVPRGEKLAVYTARLETGEVHECAIELSEGGRGAIAGRALDLAGNPVRGARIEATLNARGPSITMALARRETIADAAGCYALEELVDGLWFVQAKAPDASDACSLPSGAELDLSGGGREERDFVLGPCMEVAGTVEPRDHDLARLLVALVDARTGQGFVVERLEADRTFVLRRVLAGTWELALLEGKEVLASIPVGPESMRDLWLRPDRR